MAKQLFKNANAASIKSLMQTYNGTPLSGFDAFPSSYLINKQPADQWAQLELQYSDFKQAFSRFNLIARACSQLNSYPQIFNVYNRIVIKIYSRNSKDEKVLTTKDLYLCFFLKELQNNNVDQAHQNAISQIQNAAL